jgi:hypothetical protein
MAYTLGEFSERLDAFAKFHAREALRVEDKFMRHRLKCWTWYWDEINWGRKTFEVRSIKDRVFQAGDELELLCFDPKSSQIDYSRPVLVVYVVAVYFGLPGIDADHCVMSISLSKPDHV